MEIDFGDSFIKDDGRGDADMTESFLPSSLSDSDSVIYVCDIPAPEKFLEDEDEAEQNRATISDSHSCASSVVFMCVSSANEKEGGVSQFLEDDTNDEDVEETLTDLFFDARSAASTIDSDDENIKKVVIDEDLSTDEFFKYNFDEIEAKVCQIGLMLMSTPPDKVEEVSDSMDIVKAESVENVDLVGATLLDEKQSTPTASGLDKFEDVKSSVDIIETRSSINVDAVGAILLDDKQSLASRFRALFVLRNLKCDLSVKYIAECFGDSSALLKHELAYCLGQMQNATAVPYLIDVLEDKSQEAIVRHEASEALGAIGELSAVDILVKYVNDEEREVAETCQIALNRIQWLEEKGKDGKEEESAFDSIDPAPANSTSASIETLREILLNEDLSLWERYKSMFTLRNIASSSDNDQAVKAIAEGLKCSKSGALFRHEIAYVLGQIQSAAVISELWESLKNEDESPMVRHECAEALGAIATPECMEIVRGFAKDNERIVRESCEVALDMAEYEQSSEFQYAKLND